MCVPGVHCDKANSINVNRKIFFENVISVDKKNNMGMTTLSSEEFFPFLFTYNVKLSPVKMDHIFTVYISSPVSHFKLFFFNITPYLLFLQTHLSAGET